MNEERVASSEEGVDGRTLRYKHRRDELLEVVLDRLLQHGLYELSFRKLGAGVGVSHVTLRHHFGTKEDLLLQIFDLIQQHEPIPDDLPENQEPADLIRYLWTWWTLPRNLPYFRLLFEAYGLALQRPANYQRFLARVVGDWLSRIRSLASDAGCPPEDVDAVATVTLAQLRGLILDLLTTGDHERLAGALEFFLEDMTRHRGLWLTNLTSDNQAVPPVR